MIDNHHYIIYKTLLYNNYLYKILLLFSYNQCIIFQSLINLKFILFLHKIRILKVIITNSDIDTNSDNYMTFKIVESYRITNTVIDSNIDNSLNFNIVILSKNIIKSMIFFRNEFF